MVGLSQKADTDGLNEEEWLDMLRTRMIKLLSLIASLLKRIVFQQERASTSYSNPLDVNTIYLTALLGIVFIYVVWNMC